MRCVSELLTPVLGLRTTLSNSSTKPTAPPLCSQLEIPSVHLAWTNRPRWLCHDHVLLDNPSCPKGTVLRGEEAEKREMLPGSV